MTNIEIPEDPVQRLLEIEQRANAATPAPWWMARADYDPVAHHQPYLIRYRYDDVPTWIAESSKRKGAKADFAFIANAREDIPWLLARVRELEAERERLMEAIANAAVPIEAMLLGDNRDGHLDPLSRAEFRNAQTHIRAALGIAAAANDPAPDVSTGE